MFVLPCSRRCPLSPTCSGFRRYLSGQLQYNDKVFAIPFAFDKHHAIKETHLHAYSLTTPTDLPFIGHFKRLKAIINSLDPSTPAPIKPLRIQPLYFPTWRVHTEALSNVGIDRNHIKYQEDPKAREVEFIHYRNVYHPGHHMLPLSAVGFATSDKSSIVPWNNSMSQLVDGTDVTCLPYTISPFEYMNTLKKSLLQNTTWNDDRSMLFSCHFGPVHPVLFPVYLVQYDVVQSGSGHKPDPLTIVLEAHEEKGALFAENISNLYLHPSMGRLISATLKSLEHKVKISLESTSEGKPSSFISAYRSEMPSSVWELIAHLSTSAQQFDRIRYFVLRSWQKFRHKIDWNDPRIQPWGVEDRIWVDAHRIIKVLLLRKHLKELLKKPAIRAGDLAAIHAFLYNVDGGEELRKLQPPWYNVSLQKNTIIIKK